MSEINYVNASGERINIDSLKGKHAKAPTPKDSLKRVENRADAKLSMGFAVLGYSPAHWAQKDAAYRDAIEANRNEPEVNKHPGTLDEFERRWMNKNKPLRARSKPYELEDAANTCAELMRKAGWLHVRVEELMRG
jgi:hypothetical protein